MHITTLHDRPDMAPILARWAYNEWYRHRPLQYELVLKAFLARTKNSALPQSFLAMEGDIPLGMVTIKKDDLWSRTDLNPWLSSLYVAPEFRGRGAGHALVRAVIGRAGELGFTSIFLFLGQSDQDRLERFYLKRGWEVVDKSFDNDGLETKILGFTL
jgi:GNAT superfamily N-acetyltransferase